MSNNKLEKVKEVYKKIKEGKVAFKNLDKDIKKLIIDHVVKVVGIALLKYVVLPVVIIAAVVGLFFNVFAAFFQAILAFFGAIDNAINFFFSGRSSKVSIHTVYKTKYELEAQGIEFEEIGYLGKEFVRHDSRAMAIADVGGFSPGDDLNNATDAIDYKEALDDEIKTLKDNGAEELEITELMDKAAKFSKYPGKTLLVKEAFSTTDDDGNSYTRFKYYTIEVADDGSYVTLPEEDDYYLALNELKTNAILCYLKKYLEAQEYCFNNLNPWTLDEKDKGSIIVNFANDTEERECDEIGLWQKLFNMTTGSFSVLLKETGGEQKFYAKICPEAPEGSPEKNIDITAHVNDFAMPWRYPFAFHNSTLAPDIGYNVAELAYVHHELELELWTVKKDVDIEYMPGKSATDAHVLHNEPENSFYDDYREPGDIIATVDHMQTWYRRESYDYDEERDLSTKTKIGSMYDKVAYLEVEGHVAYGVTSFMRNKLNRMVGSSRYCFFRPWYFGYHRFKIIKRKKRRPQSKNGWRYLDNSR